MKCYRVKGFGPNPPPAEGINQHWHYTMFDANDIYHSKSVHVMPTYPRTLCLQAAPTLSCPAQGVDPTLHGPLSPRPACPLQDPVHVYPAPFPVEHMHLTRGGVPRRHAVEEAACAWVAAHASSSAEGAGRHHRERGAAAPPQHAAESSRGRGGNGHAADGSNGGGSGGGGGRLEELLAAEGEGHDDACDHTTLAQEAGEGQRRGVGAAAAVTRRALRARRGGRKKATHCLAWPGPSGNGLIWPAWEACAWPCTHRPAPTSPHPLTPPHPRAAGAPKPRHGLAPPTPPLPPAASRHRAARAWCGGGCPRAPDAAGAGAA